MDSPREKHRLMRHQKQCSFYFGGLLGSRASAAARRSRAVLRHRRGRLPRHPSAKCHSLVARPTRGEEENARSGREGDYQ
jgi:hypothetical protein